MAAAKMSTAAYESRSRFSSTAFQLLLNLLALGLFAVVVVFVQATYFAQKKSDKKVALSGLLKTDVSTTLAVVRASQGLLSAIIAIAMKDDFAFLQWAMMKAPEGLPYLSLLALSPTTGSLGTLALLRASVSKLPTKFWALLRVTLAVIVWLSGLVLFFKTSLVNVYDTVYTYNVTAGVGPFNASLVEPFINFLQSLAPQYQYQVLPFTYFASVYILVLNPLLSTISSPVQCQGDNCVSYLLSGGLEMVAPWVPQGFLDYPMVKIENVPSIQLDFTGPVDSIFLDADCDVFGESGFAIGIRICVTEVPSNPGSLRAGLFVCTDGTDGGICRTTEPPPNITTIVSFYTRKATVVAARSNYSIVSTADSTAPVQLTDIDLLAYRNALSWLLNYTAANIPPPSSIAQSFWSSSHQLKDPSTYGILLQNFQSILAFPFWIFNSNNWGNIALKENKIVPGLPPQFYTEASIVAPYIKIKFDQAMFILFVVLQGLTIVFIWAVLFWVWFGASALPKTSSYPVFDFAFRARVTGEDSQKNLLKATNSEIIAIMEEAKSFVKID